MNDSKLAKAIEHLTRDYMESDTTAHFMLCTRWALGYVLEYLEPKKPTTDEYGRKHCSVCGQKIMSIDDPDLFCCKCGQAVKWE